MIVGEFEGLRIEGGKCDDFLETFEFIGDWFFNLGFNENDFINLYENQIVDVCVARNSDNKIVCASYVLDGGYKALNFTGYNHPDYRNLKHSISCGKIALQYYFWKYPLINRIDVLGQNRDRVSRLVSQKLGFKKIGVFPKLYAVNGIDTDFYFSTILREEAGNGFGWERNK
jgi:RimJ/RimL family protein N-acetyltransferase